ncbi:MAG: mandelate racemase/muconate lactonizing enzyme family protein [Pseudomonadota bacterium]
MTAIASNSPLSSAPTVTAVDTFALQIPFTDGSAGTGLMPQKWTKLDIVLVRITCSDGIEGWGDAFAYACRAPVQAALDTMVAPLLLGSACDDVAAVNAMLQRRLHLHGRYGLTMFAISAVDIALWDAHAKRLGQPLCRILTDAPRARVDAYASLVRYGTPDQVAHYAAQAVSQGYRTLKLHEIAAETITAARKAIGPDIALATDVNCAWSKDEAATLIPLARSLDLLWVEEPVFPPDDERALAALHRQHGVALASGENACTAVEFARLMPALTYPQPSVTKVGGITECLHIMALAKDAGKTLMPHAPYFGPGYWATLQLLATLSPASLLERFFIEPEAFCGRAIPLPIDGRVSVPETPGIGFEPDHDVIERYAVRATST